MKTTLKRIPRTFLAAVFLLSASCNTGANTPQPTPSAKPNIPIQAGTPVDLTGGRSVIGGQVIDAKTNALVKNEVRLTITGQDVASVEKTSFSAQNGLLSLVLKPGVKPSLTDPLDVTVVANADGYFVASTSLHVIDSKAESFVLKMVNMKDAPNGVAVSEGTGAATNGQLQGALNLSAQEGASKSAATFELDPGTVLRDANGQPLNGNLKANIGYFSNTTSDSRASFPGGFTPNVSIGGQDQSGYFVTGGFVSVDITDSSGKKAAQFSQPADVTIQIPQGTTNPDTGKPVSSGDTIGIWSHNTSTGKWTKEADGKATGPNAQGNFDVSYQVSHLSYWNIDWHYSTVCPPKLLLKWDSDNHVPVTVTMQFEGQDWYTPSSVLADAENQLYNVPINKKLTIIAKFQDKEVGRTETTLDELCADINLPISTKDLPKLRTLPVQLTLSGKTSFTRDEIHWMGSEFNVPQDQIEQVIAYTHPSNPDTPFTFSEQALLDIEAMGVTNIRQLKMAVETKIRPTVDLYYADSNPNNWQYQYVHLDQGQGNVTVFDGAYNFGGHVYYNDNYYYIYQTVNITPDMQFIPVDMRETQLTIEAVRSFISQFTPGLPK